ncbi:hypothetical protein ATE49_10700 [Elizabethkingia miricola]|nr:thioredoxin family protein [Elizabethkingia miricola]OBS11381.1 hypothetical protein ATE49_10700 [Elizabethkingia miricola]
MTRKFLEFIIIISGLIIIRSQKIEMNFPKFAGKSYDFIIFQGDRQEKVCQGIIPDNGQFTLSVPEAYGDYTGMSRWLITGTKEGGGLDMFVPGHNFSVSCMETQPNEKNIIYTNNTGNYELNTLYKNQEGILARYQAMLLATRSYDPSNVNYSVFKSEQEKQKNDYVLFQRALRKNTDYVSRFLSIVNITRGIGGELSEHEDERGRDITHYISENLNWNTLYTSGHWSGIIESWISIHSNVLKDPAEFVKEFKTITVKIPSAELYTDFCSRVAYYLGQYGKDDYIGLITPVVISSGKIIHYGGSLSSYIRGTVGAQGPDLTLIKTQLNPETDDSSPEVPAESVTIKISDLAGGKYNQVLLLFYQSDCGHCEKLLNELSANYKKYKADGVRLIGLSSDTSAEVFKEKFKKNIPKDFYCDYKGIQGDNFKNYGIFGVPTLVLLDKHGTILYRGASLKEIQSYLRK